MRPFYLFAVALNGLLSVVLGALGAHALRDNLAARGTLDSWHTAASYQLSHALAALALVAWAAAQPERIRRLARIGACWLVGALLFSGSIYLLALGGPRSLGPITPLGGLAFIAGWLLLAVESFRPAAPAKP